jgi:hypothetical protein
LLLASGDVQSNRVYKPTRNLVKSKCVNQHSVVIRKMIAMNGNKVEAGEKGRIWSSRESADELVKFIEKWPSLGHYFQHRLSGPNADKIVIVS